jgi:hypothetical protein
LDDAPDTAPLVLKADEVTVIKDGKNKPPKALQKNEEHAGDETNG